MEAKHQSVSSNPSGSSKLARAQAHMRTPDYDSDDLQDDIEDKNASYSDYSIAKGQSTQNTSRSGNSSNSGSNSGKKKKRKRPSMFTSIFARFSRMLKKKQQNSNANSNSSSAQTEKFENFEDQLKQIKDLHQTPAGSTNQIKEKKQIFKISEDAGSSSMGGSELYNIDNPYNVTMEEEYISSSDEENQHSAASKLKTLDEVIDQNEEDEEEKEEYDEEEYGEEYFEEEEGEYITQCVHRLPQKNQRVNLLNFKDLIEVVKHVQQQHPTQKKGFFQNWFKKDQQVKDNNRFLAFVEGRLLVMKQTAEIVRKYGSHFNNQDLEKIQMPKIWWNAQICSARNLQNLEKIVLFNYKQVFESQNQNSQQPNPATQIVKLQLQWGDAFQYPNYPVFKKQDKEGNEGALQNPVVQKARVKNYLVDKESLEDLIVQLQNELRKINHFDVACIIS